MADKTEKRETLIGKIIVTSVVIFTLILCYVAYLMAVTAGDSLWMRTLNSDGPFGEQAVWVSDAGDLWLVSEDVGGANCIVYAYLRIEDGFDRVSFQPIKWERRVRVGIYETRPIYEGHPQQIVEDDSELFSCDATLKGDTLILSGFAETALRPFVGARERITLTKCDYTETVGTLPFVHVADYIG